MPKPLTESQKELLNWSGRIADKIVDANPEWADLYVPGTTLVTVAKKVGLMPEVQESVAIAALREAFTRILGKPRYQEISKANQDLGSQVALNTSTGIYSTKHQASLSEYGRRGGTTNGRAMRDEEKGIFDLSLEDRLANESAGGNQSVIARGLIPYVTKEDSPTGFGELEHTLKLSRSKSPDLTHPEGHRNAGSPNYARITAIINDTYHGKKVRKPKTLRSAAQRYLKTNFKAMKRLLNEMVTAFDADESDRVSTLNEEFSRRYEAVRHNEPTELEHLYDNCRQLAARVILEAPKLKDSALASARNYLAQIELMEAK
jgi:hypothetical protein